METGRAAGLAALMGFFAVAAGAFGAHALAGDARASELMRTAATYAAWHALASLAYLALGGRRRLTPALFLGGAVLFSGTLAALALGGPGWLGAVTPFGGAAFLAGWLLVAVDAFSGRLGPPGQPPVNGTARRRG